MREVRSVISSLRRFSLLLVIFFLASVWGVKVFHTPARANAKQVGPMNAVPDLGIGASLNGARPFPADNPWNLDVSRFSVDPNSANLIASIGSSTGLHPDFGTSWDNEPIGFPYEVVSGSQQRVPINFTDWPDESDPGPYPFPPDAPVEGGPSSTGDRHVLVVDRDNWKLYETYSTFPVNGGTSWNASNGAVWDLSSNKLRPLGWTSADAAGLPIFPGLVRRDEVLSGEIRHAFRFTANITRNSYVYPATHAAGSTNSLNAPPMGLRVRLKSTFNVDDPAFSANVRVILRAMQKYGMILADNGSNWYVSGTHDPAWNDDELSILSRVKGSDFEVVKAPTHLLMPASDFDGDGRTDVSIYRPVGSQWWYRRSGDRVVQAGRFGTDGDLIAAADITGDGKTDIAVFRPSTGQWFVLRSEDGSYFAFPFGTNGDIPVPADYDGDGKADPAVFRPSNGTWYIKQSTGGVGVVQFGAAGDQPVVADYDGDGKADIAVFRPSTSVWWIRRSSMGVAAARFGASTDKVVPGDYTGDGKADVAVWRPSNGTWFILRSEDSSYFAFPFGQSDDVPAPGDFDGDGKFDATVFRPASGNWYIKGSYAGTSTTQFGASGDKPVPAGLLP